MKTFEETHILGRIVEAKRKRLQIGKKRVPEAIVKRMAETAPSVASFRQALEIPQRVRIIAELKKASPSKGVLRQDLDVESLSAVYAKAGAVALSVVTEEDFFQGDLGWINTARKSASLPVLRKDFIFDPYQVYEARAAGASAVLLIVAMLESEQLKRLLALSRELKLDALVEVHTERELEEALQADATVIGVNNRDLQTFEVDLETSVRLAMRIPDDRLFVAESGIHGKRDIDRLLDAGANAFLIGEHLLVSPNPAAAIRGLL